MNNALTLFDHFNTLTPHTVGMDRMFDNLAKYTTDSINTGGFPPYNIRKEGEYNFVIEMALAGFGKKDIEVETVDGTLTVRSVKENITDDSDIYRGIAYRKFNRKFTIADDVVVKGATLEDGMLLINLERIIPEEKKPRLITIK